jgi:hypothetical protein
LIGNAGYSQKYTYNHVRNATSLQDILKELAGADGVCKLKDTPAPGTGTAHSVADSVSYLQAMMDADMDTDYSESAYAATSDSDTSKETRKPRGCDRKIQTTSWRMQEGQKRCKEAA